MKKKIHKWCLEVDFENGEGPDLFEIGNKRAEKDFLGQLQLTTPPPKVRVVGLTKTEWNKAVKLGAERD